MHINEFWTTRNTGKAPPRLFEELNGDPNKQLDETKLQSRMERQ
jgi:hypothetical protein